MKNKPTLSHILTHLGEKRDQYFNAISPPIIQSSNFAYKTLDEFRNAFSDELNNHIYTRGNNPTVKILRQKLAALEHAEDCLVFGSGIAALAAAIVGNVKAGDHVICVEAPYGWIQKLLTKYLHRFDVGHTFVDGRDINNIKAAKKDNTTLLILESPNSITFECQDLKACADFAKSNNIITVIDNSYASPYFQNPIDFGIDIVAHSGTKYINGHSDVVVGVVCASKAMIQKIFESELMNIGAILSPNDASLVIRGLRTLPLRIQQSHDSAMKIVAYLEQHPMVEKVYYPFSKSFPQYDLVTKQMRGAGGLFSMKLKVDKIELAEKFFHTLERFLLAVSWGGHESLVIPFCGFYNILGQEDSSLPFNLFRFYIGLEDPEWLIEDLERGFSVINK